MKLTAEVTNPGQLTAQEAVVLRHLCEGKMRKEIARSVYRSYGCVSKQIESIAQKLEAHSAAEIVAKAVANDIVKIRITHQQTSAVLIKCLLIALLINPHTMDIRQPPRQGRQSARLIKTRTETHYRSQSWT